LWSEAKVSTSVVVIASDVSGLFEAEHSITSCHAT
jgi:hypothetical protein